MFKYVSIGLLLTTVAANAQDERNEINESSSSVASLDLSPQQEIRNEMAQLLPSLQEKAAKEDPLACFQLASFYYATAPQDYAAEIVRLYTIAVNSKHIDSCYILGMAFYEEQLGLKQTDPRLIEYLTMAANAGHTEAPSYLGLAYLHGLGAPKDINVAIEWLEKAVKLDHVVGLCTYGVLLRTGDEGVETNYLRAKEYFEKATAKNYAYAMTQLGMMHHLGEGGDVNIPEAVRLYNQAVTAGRSEDPQDQALCNLGVLYLEGKQIEQDIDKAQHYLTTAADWGNVDAQCILGACLAQGKILEKKRYRGLTYLAKAAAHGDEGAKLRLEVEKSLLTVEANEGDKEAQRVLGICLMDDKIFEKDMNLGLQYTIMAAQQGDELASLMLSKIKSLSLPS
ncbi:MAG: sel1 repeat family protein [Candidatus Paracaedibacteraceae bacterium]|nr:sel1 repeat family protein [Candidatus Paracaedibacteraceae bacterium]